MTASPIGTIDERREDIERVLRHYAITMSDMSLERLVEAARELRYLQTQLMKLRSRERQVIAALPS